jgi:hypothetical protein
MSEFPSKTCGRCRETKPPMQFSASTHSTDGLQSYCRLCARAYNAERRRKDSDDEDESTSDLYVLSLSIDPQGSAHGVKIGRSIEPKRRAAQIGASLPFEAQLVATFPGQGHREPRVHEALARHRNLARGQREWFMLEPWAAVALVAELLQRADLSNDRGPAPGPSDAASSCDPSLPARACGSAGVGSPAPSGGLALERNPAS